LLGHDFTEQDNPATAIELPEHLVAGMQLADPLGRHGAIVNETFVRHFFTHRNALGMHVSLEGPFRSSYEIVGIVKDARYFGLRDGAEPMMFVPVWRRFAE
jgi:hypothetical protein